MKRALKRTLPIVLSILVICSVIWYLFVYDRNFTRDMLLHQARFFDDHGHYSISAWLYEQAYRQANDNETVAIELSEQFKSMGKYTKAEYTLSRAIADGGSAELYIALCKTYVEQDKLLDAVTMLDNIADETIKAQLSAIRPAAPAVSPEPGFYSQYIPVTVTAPSGSLFLSMDSEYPSIASGIHSGNITLKDGENTIYALTVGENGLVSPLAIYGYTVGGVIEEVTLKDSRLDAEVRKKLDLKPEETLYSNQLWTITSLEMPEGMETYEDLSRFTGLEALTVANSSARDLSSLAGLSRLHSLTIRDSFISSEDLKVIASLPGLQKLSLTSCNLSSLAPLEKAVHLTHLNLENNAIRDIAPLSFLSGLQHINLSHNALNNLTALSSLTALTELDVSYNGLVSVTPLMGCSALQKLYINNNQITDLTGLENMKQLTELNAGFNALTDVSALASVTQLQWLDVESNSLTDITMLSPLAKLRVLNFSRNQISALPAFPADCALATIDGTYNQIATVSTLAEYQNLNNVLMDHNQISSINSLLKCGKLIKVSVFGNPVSEFDKETFDKRGIIVNYTPDV